MIVFSLIRSILHDKESNCHSEKVNQKIPQTYYLDLGNPIPQGCVSCIKYQNQIIITLQVLTQKFHFENYWEDFTKARTYTYRYVHQVLILTRDLHSWILLYFLYSLNTDFILSRRKVNKKFYLHFLEMKFFFYKHNQHINNLQSSILNSLQITPKTGRRVSGFPERRERRVGSRKGGNTGVPDPGKARGGVPEEKVREGEDMM